MGTVLLIAAPALAIGAEYAARRDVRIADMALVYAAFAPPGDSSGYKSITYHGARAKETLRTRWHPAGHGMLGSFGTVLGIGLVLPGFRRRVRATGGDVGP